MFSDNEKNMHRYYATGETSKVITINIFIKICFGKN